MQQRKVNRIAVVLTSLILITLLSSCSSVPKTVTYQSAPVDKPNLILPDSTVLALRDVDFLVVTEDNVADVIAALKASNSNIALFALTDKGYENLSLNNADVLELLSQQRSIIAAYKLYYEGINISVDDYNDNRDVVIPVPVDAGIADKVIDLFKD